MDKWIKENRITTGIILVLIVVFGLTYFSRQPIKNTSSGTDTNLALQTKCADRAASFYKQGGYGDNSQVWIDSYTNHWNNKLDKCFIQITGLSMKDSGFSFIDVFDVFEGKHYATYMGHYDCNGTTADGKNKCQLDSGSIWFDGNDTRNPPDYHVGFQGVAVGPGVGDENTQEQFLAHIQPFMSE